MPITSFFNNKSLQAGQINKSVGLQQNQIVTGDNYYGEPGKNIDKQGLLAKAKAYLTNMVAATKNAEQVSAYITANVSQVGKLIEDLQGLSSLLVTMNTTGTNDKQAIDALATQVKGTVQTLQNKITALRWNGNPVLSGTTRIATNQASGANAQIFNAYGTTIGGNIATNFTINTATTTATIGGEIDNIQVKTGTGGNTLTVSFDVSGQTFTAENVGNFAAGQNITFKNTTYGNVTLTTVGATLQASAFNGVNPTPDGLKAQLEIVFNQREAGTQNGKGGAVFMPKINTSQGIQGYTVNTSWIGGTYDNSGMDGLYNLSMDTSDANGKTWYLAGFDGSVIPSTQVVSDAYDNNTITFANGTQIRLNNVNLGQLATIGFGHRTIAFETVNNNGSTTNKNNVLSSQLVADYGGQVTTYQMAIQSSELLGLNSLSMDSTEHLQRAEKLVQTAIANLLDYQSALANAQNVVINAKDSLEKAGLALQEALGAYGGDVDSVEAAQKLQNLQNSGQTLMSMVYAASKAVQSNQQSLLQIYQM